MPADVSIIVPCYNYGRFLDACVTSVLTQEGAQVEVLIIDDASSDDTPQVGRRLAEDARVEFRRHERNAGHIATYNEGLRWTRGELTLLLSADDMLPPGALRRALSVMRAHPHVSMVFGEVRKFTGAPPQLEDVKEPFPLELIPRVEWLRRRVLRADDAMISPEIIVRTSVQHRVGEYDARLPHTADVEMRLRYALYGDVAFLPGTVQGLYRDHSDGMHRRVFGALINDVVHRKAAFDAFFERYGHAITPRTLPEVYRWRLGLHALRCGLGLLRRGQEQEQAMQLMRFSLAVLGDAPPSWRSAPALLPRLGEALAFGYLPTRPLGTLPGRLRRCLDEMAIAAPGAHASVGPVPAEAARPCG